MMVFGKIYSKFILLSLTIINIANNAINVYYNSSNNIKTQWFERIKRMNQGEQRREDSYFFSIFARAQEKPSSTPCLTDFNNWLSDSYLYFNTFILIIMSLSSLYLILSFLTRNLYQTIDRTSHVVGPKRFTAHTNPKSWIESFELYLQADSIFDDKKKVAAFLSRLDDDCSRLIKGNCYLYGNEITYVHLKRAILELYSNNPNSQSENHEKFLACVQRDEENVARYYTCLSQLCHKAFRDLSKAQRDKIVGERFIDGITSDPFRAELRKHVTVKPSMFSSTAANQYATLLSYAITLEQIYAKRNYTGLRINRIHETAFHSYT